jgi:hypothetical protein
VLRKQRTIETNKIAIGNVNKIQWWTLKTVCRDVRGPGIVIVVIMVGNLKHCVLVA